MKKTGYILTKLNISRMPGLPTGLRPIENPASGINIIHGPNASGKTSTARAIQHLIATEAKPGMEARGWFTSDDIEYYVNIYAGQVTTQRNGVPIAEKPVPLSPEEKHRYMLAVHELLTEQGTDLAKEIARQSIGGYDPGEAAKTLGYSPQISSKGISEYKALEAADTEVYRIQGEQEALLNEQQSIAGLEISWEKAKHAGVLQELYRLALDFDEKKQNLEQSNAVYSSFPEVLEKLREDDFERLTDLMEKRDSTIRGITDAKKKQSENEAELKGLSITEAGTDQHRMNELEEVVDRLRKTESDLEKKKQELEGMTIRMDKALGALGPEADPEALAKLDVHISTDLDQFFIKANDILAVEASLKAEIATLESRLQDRDSTTDSETLKQAIKSLQLWLKDSEVVSAAPRWPILVVAGLGVAAALAVFCFGTPALWGLIAVIAAAIWAWLVSRPKDDDTSRQTRRRDFEALNIDPISEWNVEEVSQRLVELTDAYQSALEKEHLDRDLQNLQQSLDAHKTKLEAIDKEKRAWMDRLGAVPQLSDFKSDTYNGMYWFLKNLIDWREHYTKGKGLAAEIQKLEADLDGVLIGFNNLLESTGFEAAANPAQATARFKSLRDEAVQYRSLVNEIKHDENGISESEKRLVSQEEDMRKIFDRLGMTEDDMSEIKTLTAQLSDYRTAVEQVKIARRDRDAAWEKLQGHRLFSEHRVNLENASARELQDAADDFGRQAEEADSLRTQITQIETKIDERKKGHDLEKALADKQKALENLREQFDRNLRSLTGSVIAKKLELTDRDQNQPLVFRRANDILTQITNGRYELQIDRANGDTSFRAFDTVYQQGLALHELSSGTRVQLLLAVRLAFIDVNERQYALPLLADELLANSDDLRAKAIIDALINFAKSGRQIFYFTAQGDEVRKWERYLVDHPDCEAQIIELTEGKVSVPQFLSDTILPDIDDHAHRPPPEGRSHEEYGEIIGVKPYHPLLQQSGELHLWFLIEDVDLLYEYTLKGIQRWGQLDQFLKYADPADEFEEKLRSEWKASLALLDRYRTLIQEGQPKPIDREVLEKSGAVSANFIDQVDEKLRSLNGNPERLIASMKSGEILRFRSDNIALLEEYLIANQYIDDRDPLDGDTIRIRLEAFISNHDMDSDGAWRFIERIEKSSDLA